VVKGKFIALSTYLKKSEKPQKKQAGYIPQALKKRTNQSLN
jgi:hypothetical protein